MNQALLVKSAFPSANLVKYSLETSQLEKQPLSVKDKTNKYGYVWEKFIVAATSSLGDYSMVLKECFVNKMMRKSSDCHFKLD